MPRPFCFAWVDETATTFGVEHQVEDEKIFSFNLSHAEAGKPTLEIEILNPYVGLPGPGRKQWAWFSRYNGSAYEPLFFGRLMGIANSLFGEIITLVLVADPPDYLDRKQAVAQGRERPGAFAVGPFRSNVADQQAEGAGDQRCQDLLVKLRDVEEGNEREEEGRKASGTRQDRVADLLSRACFHASQAPLGGGYARLLATR